MPIRPELALQVKGIELPDPLATRRLLWAARTFD